jgi:hypothetical protein
MAKKNEKWHIIQTDPYMLLGSHWDYNSAIDMAEGLKELYGSNVSVRENLSYKEKK